MRIFKFGGASVKDALGVQNTLKVLLHEGVQNTLVVVSAMGKMTNAFENLVNAYAKSEGSISNSIQYIVNYHENIAKELFEENNVIFKDIDSVFNELGVFLETNKNSNYNFIYDQIVCFGELLSTKIMSAYLTNNGVQNVWLDIRTIIKTDQKYRKANVNWDQTLQNCQKHIDKNQLYITQGFIGSDTLNNESTTLGREGSDFTAEF